jgi:hypothetical protein
MVEVAECPKCQRPLQIPASFIGQVVQCPQCGHQFEAAPPSTAVEDRPSAPAPIDRPRRPRSNDDDDYDYDDDIEFERLRRIRAGGAPHRGEGMVQAGRILGIIATCLGLAIVALLCVIFGGVFLAEH